MPLRTNLIEKLTLLGRGAELHRDDLAAYSNSGAPVSAPPMIYGCSVRQLPDRLMLRSADVANKVNPVNSPVFGPSSAPNASVLPTPYAAAVVTSKYWGPTPRTLTVSFMESTPADLRSRIVANMNAWTATGCISFVETSGTGQVRISFGSGGYWSYLGTDILLVPANRQTMNLQGFTMATFEQEFHRVVRHEAGHTLGMPHEHMRHEIVQRIDPAKAYDYFWQTQHWDRATVDQQVLTPLEDATIIGTPADQDSIMCYQLPGSITKDGNPIRGGLDINQSDYHFVGRIYPKPGSQPPRTGSDTDVWSDWPENEDVGNDMILK